MFLAERVVRSAKPAFVSLIVKLFAIARKGFFLLNLRVTCVNLVYEVFECEVSFASDGESLVAVAKFR